MIYHLLYPLSTDLSALNVLRYITFRSMLAMLTALVLSIAFGPRFIGWLKKIKCGQYIQEDGPNHQSKAGTPTMGGAFLGGCLLLSVLMWGNLQNPYLWLTIFVFSGFGLVGFVDDYIKEVRKNNQGLSARTKFLGQVIVACGALTILINLPGYSSELMVPSTSRMVWTVWP